MRMLRMIAISLLWLASIPLAVADSVDINRADAEAIADVLHGVGPTKAARIVEYRERNGFFTSVDELTNVKGIGEKTLERNRDQIRLGSSDAPTK